MFLMSEFIVKIFQDMKSPRVGLTNIIYLDYAFTGRNSFFYFYISFNFCYC